MGWSIGYDTRWKRDIGYTVPAYCDHPGCMAEIDRGLGYVCGGEPYGGGRGCGLFFCMKHGGGARCWRCRDGKLYRKKIAPEHPEWIAWKLTDKSWSKWRKEEPNDLARFCAAWAALTDEQREKAMSDVRKWQDANESTTPAISEGEKHEEA